MTPKAEFFMVKKTADAAVAQGVKWLTPGDAAHILGVSARTIQRLAVAGKITSKRVGFQLRIDASAPLFRDNGDNGDNGDK